MHLGHTLLLHLLHSLSDKLGLLIASILELHLVDRLSVKGHLHELGVFFSRLDRRRSLPRLISLLITGTVDEVVVLHLASVQLPGQEVGLGAGLQLLLYLIGLKLGLIIRLRSTFVLFAAFCEQ